MWPGFPRQDPALVEEIVGAAHAKEPRVRELLDLHPALANAAWDWGFGDWETPLGAASHMGRRDIAELLLSRGARLDLFAAAMLDQADVVRAMIAARPGVQATLGPHGITLLAHARTGKAAAVVSLLEEVGGADPKIDPAPIDESDAAACAGDYAYSDDPADRLTVTFDRGRLSLRRGDGTPRMLHHRGSRAFYPAGVPSVTIRFEPAEGQAASVSIAEQGRDPMLVARRA